MGGDKGLRPLLPRRQGGRADERFDHARLTHYFRDRDAITAFANKRVFADWREELEAATSDVAPVEMLRNLLQWALPVNEQQRDFARAVISLTDCATSNQQPATRRWPRNCTSETSGTGAKSAASSKSCSHRGPSRRRRRRPVSTGVDEAADIVRALLNGINPTVLQSGESWTAERQLRHVDDRDGLRSPRRRSRAAQTASDTLTPLKTQ
ncbi:hypothetical protein [Streptomyces sp. NPDC059262]|uniref:hypothetical protein n=1 Tax=Streptomyces sp. NPDC059262 TaxID=3346797 RepID=UPI0036A1E2D8